MWHLMRPVLRSVLLHYLHFYLRRRVLSVRLRGSVCWLLRILSCRELQRLRQEHTADVLIAGYAARTGPAL